MFKNTISFLTGSDLMNETALFSILDCVDSTNNYAMGQVHAGLARHGQAWFAREQTAGRGQRGKTWETGKNENIALSIAVVPSGLKPHQQFRLSIAVALACYDFFYEIAGAGTSIKWPNDLYWRDRKAGGILIENILQGNEWRYAVVGIGINVNQVIFDPAAGNAYSLRNITGDYYDPVVLGEKLYKKVMDRVDALNEITFPELLSEYNRYLYKLGSYVNFKKDGEILSAKILGVTETGKLQTSGTGNNEFNFGEVQWQLS